MTSILIASRGADSEATLVAAALAEVGHPPILWMTSNFPTCQSHAISIGPNDASFKVEEGAPTNGVFDLSDIDVVWRRRVSKPYVEPSGLRGDDLLFARAVAGKYHASLWAALSLGLAGARAPLWVNSWTSALKAESKLLQLTVARTIGFRVPDTLVSNDRDEIKRFIRSRPATIRKSLVMFSWLEDGKRYRSYASDINEHDLDDAERFLAVPEIFQTRIDKVSELRVTVFGRSFFAVEISSNGNPSVDFRVFHERAEHIKIVELPSDLMAMVHKLVVSLGLIFAVVEIMVDANGEFVFTEVNEAGQFLWMTNIFPEHPVLDAFARFLISGDPDFEWMPSGRMLLADDVHSGDCFQQFLQVEKGGLFPPLSAAV